MTRNNRFKITEISLLVLIWIVLIASPVLFRTEEEINWGGFRGPLTTLIPLFILFLINRFLLLPKLLFRNEKMLYLISVGGIIAVFTLTIYFLPLNQGFYTPPERMGEYRPQPPPEQHMRNDAVHPPLHPEAQRGGPIPPFANLLIFSFLLVGFDTGLRISFKLSDAEREKSRLEKENVGSQLAFLRNQINPHFFMNTLNNIHALIDFDKEGAKDSIIKLSKMMRHLLYESNGEMISLKEEMSFLGNYIELMNLRLTENVDVQLNIPDVIPDGKIPPLILTPFIENAYKHGVSYSSPSYIRIRVEFLPKKLNFFITNTKKENSQNDDQSSGIGIKNTRKRLDLIYNTGYQLDISDNSDIFVVDLSIPI